MAAPHKTCANCGTFTNDFHRKTSAPDGFDYRCRTCNKDFDKQRYISRKSIVFPLTAEKRCNGKCQMVLPAGKFMRDPTKKDGLGYKCSECINDSTKPGLIDGHIHKKPDATLCAICEKFIEGRAVEKEYARASGRVRGFTCHRCSCIMRLWKGDPDALHAKGYHRAATYIERARLAGRY